MKKICLALGLAAVSMQVTPALFAGGCEVDNQWEDRRDGWDGRRDNRRDEQRDHRRDDHRDDKGSWWGHPEEGDIGIGLDLGGRRGYWGPYYNDDYYYDYPYYGGYYYDGPYYRNRPYYYGYRGRHYYRHHYRH